MTPATFTFCRFATDETLTPAEVRALIEGGKIAGTTLLQRSDSRDWKPANEFPELKSAFDAAPKRPRRPVKILKGFQAKFTGTGESTPSQTSSIRFLGVFFVIVATFMCIVTGRTFLTDLQSARWPQVQATAVNWSEYEYNVKGRTYAGTHPEGYLHRGQHFNVFYDPGNPAKSLVENGAKIQELGALLFCAAFAMFAIAMVIVPEKIEKLGWLNAG